MSKSAKLTTLFIIVAPLVAVILIPFTLPHLFSWEGFVQFPLFYTITVLGITLSYHREHTHQAVRFTPGARFFWYLSALLSLEGMGRVWVAKHTKHHKYTDKDGDPHSPHGFGNDVMGVLKGFFHAHVGWLLDNSDPECEKYAGHVLRDKRLVQLDNLFPLWAVLTFILPGLLTMLFGWRVSWVLFLSGVFWGGFVRIFFVHHVTWLINSWCHLFGERPFKGSTEHDMSTNNWFLGIISFGEGFHRNHHAFPRSARIGLGPREYDFGWTMIRLQNYLGLVEKYIVPTEKEMLESAVSN